MITSPCPQALPDNENSVATTRSARHGIELAGSPGSSVTQIGVCLWWIFGDVFRSKDMGGVAKTFWVLFVILIPWLGILVSLLDSGAITQAEFDQVKTRALAA